MKPQKHIFVCVNERPIESPKGDCTRRGGKALLDALRGEIFERGWQKRIKVTKVQCLGPCVEGPNMVIYPEGVWYRGVSVEDVKTILTEHIENDTVIERLLLPEDKI